MLTVSEHQKNIERVVSSETPEPGDFGGKKVKDKFQRKEITVQLY